jgi:Fur family transcriptional regulator, iron response regulator
MTPVNPSLVQREPAHGQAGGACVVRDLRDRLRGAGLRPTRQRLSLGWLIFAKGHRHLSAEALFEEASRSRLQVSLATVYNTLNQFTDAGLLREIAVDGTRTYFDTNIDEHHHFFIEDEARVIDIPASAVEVSDVPPAPEGFEIARVDVVVRLRRKAV